MIEAILEDHLDEIEFLYESRCRDLHSLRLDGRHLAEGDHRLVAHLEGFLLGGEASWALCENRLWADASAEEVFGATFLAAAADCTPWLEVLAGVLFADANESVLDGIVGALSLLPPEIAQSTLKGPLAAENAPRCLALECMTFHRLAPLRVPLEAFEGASVRDRVALAQAAGVFREVRLASAVEALVEEETSHRRGTCLEALALLAPDRARRSSHALLESDTSPTDALRILGMLGHPSDADLITPFLSSQDDDVRRAAVLALAAIGDPAHISDLFALLGENRLGKIAGQGIARVLGARFPSEDLLEETHSNGKREDEGDDLSAGSWTDDDELPRLSHELAEDWWNQHSDEFSPGVRLRHGHPFEPRLPEPTTVLGLTRAEALEVALAHPDEPLAQVQGLACRYHSPRLVGG